MFKNDKLIQKLHLEILHLNPNYFEENNLKEKDNKYDCDNNKKSFYSYKSSINTNDVILTDNVESSKRFMLSPFHKRKKIKWIDKQNNNKSLATIIQIESFKQYNLENSYKGNIEEVFNRKKCCYKCYIF